MRSAIKPRTNACPKHNDLVDDALLLFVGPLDVLRFDIIVTMPRDRLKIQSTLARWQYNRELPP